MKHSCTGSLLAALALVIAPGLALA